MAKATGQGATTIGRMRRAFGLQPHRSETFKRSKDPLFVDQLRNIVGLYMSPPDQTADQIFESLAASCMRISGPGR